MTRSNPAAMLERFGDDPDILRQHALTLARKTRAGTFHDRAVASRHRPESDVVASSALYDLDGIIAAVAEPSPPTSTTPKRLRGGHAL